MLHKQIKNELHSAMKEKDSVRLNTLRSVLTSATNELILQKQKPDAELDDKSMLKVIQKAVKQRKDSYNQFIEANRKELAKKEEEEIKILETYLPQQISEKELYVHVRESVSQVEDKTNRGLVMKKVMSELSGKADGKRIACIVEELLK